MKVTLKKREVYGKVLMYPGCDLAQKFCELKEQKTLTNRDVNLIKKMGHDVEFISYHQ